jgi:ribosomal protein L11 methyltransferase
VKNRFGIVCGELLCVRRGEFGLILSNIQLNTIEQLLGQMMRLLSADGTLLLSGILTQERSAAIRSLTASGLEVIEELTENGWVALAARRLP